MYYHDENLLVVFNHMNIKTNVKCCVEIKNCFGYLQARLVTSNGIGDKVMLFLILLSIYLSILLFYSIYY